MRMKLLLENWRKFVNENEELEEANLSTKELSKVRGGKSRLDQFIQKIANDSPFITTDDKEVLIDKSALELLQKLKDAGNFSDETLTQIFGSKNIVLPTVDGSSVRLTSLKKTKDIGGEDPARRLEKEYAARGQLQTLIDGALQASEKDSITIEIRGEDSEPLLTINGVTGIDDQGKVGGVDPKADFVLIRKEGLPSIYISHKDGISPKDFGQWGGVSAKSGEEVVKHPEVLDFVQTLKNSEYIIDGALRPAFTVGRKIKDPQLQVLAIFGSECFGSNIKADGSPNNVDIVAQGTFKLESFDSNKFILSANHMMVRKGFKNDFGEGYEPILIARTGDRNSFGILRTRISIYPEAGRVVRAWI